MTTVAHAGPYEFPDDFDWLPDRLAQFDVRPRLDPPRRIEGGPSNARVSALQWGDPARTRSLYLHGGGQNAHTWDVVIALVGEPALAVDLPGHGHSAWRADRDYRPRQNAAAIAALVDELGLRQVKVVGMSWGGVTATALVELRPDLVEQLTLIDVLPGVEDTTSAMTAEELGAVALVMGARTFPTFEAMLDSAAAARGRRSEHLERGVRHNARRREDGQWIWRYDDLTGSDMRRTDDLWPALERFPGPVRLVRGGASRFVAETAIDRLRTVRPDADVIVVPGAGHSVQGDAPLPLSDILGRTRD